MTTTPCRSLLLFALLAGTASACQLRPPDVVPPRMLEPQLVEPQRPSGGAGSAAPIRLLETQARGHIGRRLLHQRAGGELAEDPIWRWSSAPDRYLDSAIRRALASSVDLRLLDAGNVPSLAVTLIAWNLDASDSPRLVGSAEVTVTAADRAVFTDVVRGSEAVSSPLPGDLAAAAGRLLGTLGAESLARARQALR